MVGVFFYQFDETIADMEKIFTENFVYLFPYEQNENTHAQQKKEIA